MGNMSTRLTGTYNIHDFEEGTYKNYVESRTVTVGTKTLGVNNQPLIWNQSTPQLLIPRSLVLSTKLNKVRRISWELVKRWMKILRLLTYNISLLHLKQTSLNHLMLYPLKLQTLIPPVMTFSRNMTTLSHSTKRQLVKVSRKESTSYCTRTTEDSREKHQEAAVNYANLKASIDDYYDEKIAHRDQTDKLVEAFMSSLDKSSTTISFNYSNLQSSVNALQAHALKQDEKLAAWGKSSTIMAWNLGSRLSGQSSGSVTSTLALTYILTNVEGENDTNTATEDPPSHTEGETDANKQEKSEEPRHSTNANIEFIGLSNHKNKANAHMDKEEQIKKAKEEDKLFSISKPKVIKVVQEEAKKLGIHLKEAITTKAGDKFKKAHDAEHEVLKRQHTKKVRKSLELRKHKFKNYMWTISNRLKPDTITDIKIHPKTKPIVITVFRGIDDRNFDVHKPFAFASSKSSRKKRKHIEFEPEIKIPRLECNRALPKNILFVNNMVIEDHEYGIFFTDEFGDQAFQRWSDIDKVRMEALVSYLVAASMGKSPKNARFSIKLKKLIAEHPDQEKLKSKKVKLEARGYEMN
ncbi:hypothetical protein Tco_0108797 [Tanacetum coccineum]